MTPGLSATTLHPGTTLRHARKIEANGPDPDYREPGSGEELGDYEGVKLIGLDHILASLSVAERRELKRRLH